MNNDTKHELQDQDMIKQQFDQWWEKNYPHYPQETTHGFSLWEAFKAGAEWQLIKLCLARFIVRVEYPSDPVSYPLVMADQ